MSRAPGGVLALLLLCRLSGVALGAEEPPAQGTRLHLQKTLSILSTPLGRIFAETRQIDRTVSLRDVLRTEYGVSPDAVPPLTEAFQALNPGADPERLAAGRTVRIPFKVEETPAPPTPAAASDPASYVVRQGDSLWRVLKRRYKVSKAGMATALTAVAKANRAIRDLNHLLAGQKIFIPESVAGTVTRPPVSTPQTSASSAPNRSALSLLRDMGCRVTDRGENFLPLARGRTVRLDARDFPMVTGPSGRSVILDFGTRMSPALTRAVEDAWGYSVLQGREATAEDLVTKLLPRLGFYELTEGSRASQVLPGVEMRAQTRWTVVPTPEDLWEGRIHLLFPPKAAPDPAATAVALRAGYSVHVLDGLPEAAAQPPKLPSSETVPEIPWSDARPGDSAVLAALGLTYSVLPDVECDLGGGVRYHLRPEITFEHKGTRYAVPPREPRRAEALLDRMGYFTIRLPSPSDPYERIGDLLALLGIRSRRETAEAPKGGALRLRVEGLVFVHEGAARRLYPSFDARGKDAKLFLTRAQVSPEAAAVLMGEGYLPWVLHPPEPEAPRPGRRPAQQP